MSSIRTGLWLIVSCAVLATVISAYRAMASVENEAFGQQDVINLDRRISLLEQRLYSIESRISNVEQQAALSSSQRATTPAPRDLDSGIGILSREIEALKLRLKELECGLVRIDERTISASAKDAQKRAGTQSKDPCRQDPEAPVRLSSRP